ncbi:MAG: hypothetical protein MJ170_01965 [Alphaproteobacteria bacterium]|nr:hypothetical protein [Alphaproteobacteria bacterium]
MSKRLFIFAGYDKDGIIDDTLVYYLTELSKLGDIVLVMDCDVNDTTKLQRIKNILHTELARHNQYDFGSYKRGYMWAYNNKVLDKYDWVYLVNDSVYGPLWDIKPILTKLESSKKDLIGMTSYESAENPIHIQSWFVGMSKKLALKSFIKDFFMSVIHQQYKHGVILHYEVRLSRIILQNGYEMCAYHHNSIEGKHDVYQNPIELLKNNFPFLKKAAISALKNIEFLYQFSIETDFIQKIQQYIIRTNKNMTDLLAPYCDELIYKTIYQIKLFGIPLLKITYNNKDSYHVFAFGFIKMLKIMKHTIKD